MTPHRPRLALIATLAWAASAAVATAARASEERFVIVVANNRSLTAGVAVLRYADDDGARFYELLAPGAARISLMTVFDEETQRLHRDLAQRVESPTRAGLYARVAEYNVLMDAARARGAEPVLELVFIGHGEVAPDGEGYVSLLDAPLRRRDLYREVIAPSRATFNHIVIDACNSYLMVARRGGDDRGPSRADAIAAYLAVEDLDRYPNTGVILSTSRARATHEWSVIGGGIFSHELRSALAGAADVNGDGRVEYSEAAAFLAAANLRIDDPDARLDVFVRAPSLDRSRPLIDLARGGFRHFVRLPIELEGHLHLEDARGVRYADVNKSRERAVTLALVDSEYYFLRDEQREVRLSLGSPGRLDVRPAAMRPRAVASRGAVEESLRLHLFEVPFGPGFYRGYVASARLLPVVEAPVALFAPRAAGLTLGEHPRLVAQVTALAGRARTAGLRTGDDPYLDHLVDWAERCARAGDDAEVERTMAAAAPLVERPRLARSTIERKLARAGAALEIAAPEWRAALAPDLHTARAALATGDLALANAIANRLLDAIASK